MSQTNNLHVVHALQWDDGVKEIINLADPRDKVCQGFFRFFFWPVIFLPTLKTNLPCVFLNDTLGIILILTLSALHITDATS